MKRVRLFLALVCALGLLLTGCETPSEPVVDTPTQGENPEDEGGEDDDDDNGENNSNGNGGDDDNNSWLENREPLPDATYKLAEGLLASSYVGYSDGHRNDYMSFYDEKRDYALYLDIYTDESNQLLTTGRYLLADNYDNAVYREWSYLTLQTNGELHRFTEGWVEVIADAEHSSGFPYHNIRAYFVMESGESVSLEYEGTILLK